jgi:hypothetical protein
MLSAIRVEPVQTPLLSVDTQVPLAFMYLPFAQMVQSLDVEPEQVWHSAAQGVQLEPLLKDPSGQTWPEVVDVFGAKHFVLSLAFWVNPDLHWTHSPVPSEHWSQPSWHTA